MDTLNSKENENAYKGAIPLSKAIFEFGNSELLKKLNSILEIQEPKFKSNSFFEILHEGVQNLQKISITQNSWNEIHEKLKSDILKKIQNGELVALGLELPISTESQPIQIPSYLFSGEINWENSELRFKNLEFTGIKVLKAETKENCVLGNSDIKNNLNLKNQKPKQIADIDPQSYLTEKELAEILNISPRTLQGQRIKGGGIPFHKIGKAVRYRVGEVLKWIQDQKKENTIS